MRDDARQTVGEPVQTQQQRPDDWLKGYIDPPLKGCEDTHTSSSRRRCPTHGEYISQCPACSSPAPADPRTFLQDLGSVINRHSQENGSDTPDFILAVFLERCLSAWNSAIGARSTWYGRHDSIGGGAVAPASTLEAELKEIDTLIDRLLTVPTLSPMPSRMERLRLLLATQRP